MTAPHQQPQFSIIIPTGNRVKLAKMAAESVLNQSYQNFEIIIADWAHTNEAREIAVLDKRIKYLKTDSREPYGGWNIAARQSQGNYILFLDDDNYLLPYALELFSNEITETRADVITSNHLYYYDSEHPRIYLRNSLGVIPFTGKKSWVDLRQAIKNIFAFKRSSVLPRFHTSSTIVSSRIINQSLQKLGFIVLDYLPNMHSMFPILSSFAKTCVFVDHPTVIVGRYGNSLSQNWAIAARYRFKKQLFPITMSPLCGYTRINGTLENFLNVKNILPDFYRDIQIDYEQFAKIYTQELAYLDTDFITLIKNWINLFSFLKTFSPKVRKLLAKKALKFAALAPIVYISRRLKLYLLWRVMVKYFVSNKENKKTAAEKIGNSKEFYISLEEKYNVDSIDALAKNVGQILIAETNRDIFSLPQ